MRRRHWRNRLFLWFARHPEVVASPITGFISIASVLLGIILVGSPNQTLEPTSIGQALPFWQEVLWAIMLGAGGALTLLGLLIPHKPSDVYGTLLLAGTLLIDAVAIITNRRWEAGSITAMFLTALAAGLILRAAVVSWLSGVLAQIGDRRHDEP